MGSREREGGHHLLLRSGARVEIAGFASLRLTAVINVLVSMVCDITDLCKYLFAKRENYGRVCLVQKIHISGVVISVAACEGFTF